MSRLMSVALTEDAVHARRKTVTRRLGWATLKPGTKLTLCRKVMGRKRADGTVEPLVRIAEVEVVAVRREPLDSISPGETALEGFPEMTGAAFVDFFCEHMRCTPGTVVTRVEWRYLDADQQPAGVAL
ncbi:hypothetical protein [Dactylosporangium sp. CA-139066]|uniref:hypothetical protein n=1 Tax=Dactylosporangium sp. CA-139066 TaxID=3239930 RepID=UPI003D8BF0E5